MADFVHLHVHTDYSLLDGAAKIEPLVSRAKELGFTALAITDHGNMFGAIDFSETCKKNGIKPLIGCEFYVAGGSRLEKTGTEQGNHYYHLILIAKNTEGYRNLMRLTSLSYGDAFYYKPRIDNELLEKYHGGLICLSACIAGELPQLLLSNDTARAEEFVMRYKKWFGDENFFIELQDHGIDEQRRVAPRLIDLAQKTNTPMVLTNDSHYVLKEDWEAHDVLLCIGRQEKLKDPKHEGYGAKEFYLKNADEMAALFPNHPEMLVNTCKIAALCEDDIIPKFEAKDLKDCLPVYQIPPEYESDEAYLRHLVYEGLLKRYPSPDGTLTGEIKERAEMELGVIVPMGFTGYFLIVWDFINWAKEHDIPIGPGRGSGAGSIVAYAMGITNMDPLRFNLFFERFLNPERITMPDFDIDISDEGRQAVIEYTRQKYGDPQVGHIVTFSTLKAKQVIKDVGRVLEIPLNEVNMLTKLIPGDLYAHLKDAFEVNPDPEKAVAGSAQLAPYRNDERYQRLFDLCLKLEDVHRNTSLHASGIVIGKSQLMDWAPVFTLRDKKTDTQIIATQYTMNQIEACGLVKMDYLGLKTLSLIKRTEELVRKLPGFENFSVEHIDEHDAKTFDLFCKGKTAGFFQFESGGMQNALRQAKPSRIEDIMALNALYRPGPMAYIPQFVESKLDHTKIKYPDPCLEGILKETYGVMVYQEQVMQAAQKIAGYTLGRADILRKAMGKKKRKIIDAEKTPFIEGAVKSGFDAKHAAEIFEIMAPFAGYGFNKSHAAAYSIIAYQTAYLKAHFPAEFIAANLTKEITGANDKLAKYLAEGREMGITITPPDVNSSGRVFEVVDGKIVFGLTGIKGLGEKAADEIIEARKKDGPFKSFIDFLERLDLHTVNKKALEVLIKTGSFDSLGQPRAELFLNMENAVEYAEHKKADSETGQASLFGDAGVSEFADFVFEQVEDWPLMEKLTNELELIGCYVSGHPLDNYRKVIETSASMTTDRLKYAQTERGYDAVTKKYRGTQYTMVGIIKNLEQKISKKTGKQFATAELEDLTGTVALIFWADAWEKTGEAVKSAIETGSPVLALSGSVQEDTFSASTNNGAATEEDAEDSGETDTKYQFVVEDILDINNLAAKAIQEVHIALEPVFTEETQLDPIRNLLSDVSGDCMVYFHLETTQGPITIKAHTSLRVPSSGDFIEKLKSKPLVESLWTE